MWFDVTPVCEVEHMGVRQGATLFATCRKPKALYSFHQRSVCGVENLPLSFPETHNGIVPVVLFVNVSFKVRLHLFHETSFFILSDDIFKHEERLEETELVLLRKFRMEAVQVWWGGGC